MRSPLLLRLSYRTFVVIVFIDIFAQNPSQWLWILLPSHSANTPEKRQDLYASEITMQVRFLSPLHEFELDRSCFLGRILKPIYLMKSALRTVLAVNAVRKSGQLLFSPLLRPLRRFRRHHFGRRRKSRSRGGRLDGSLEAHAAMPINNRREGGRRGLFQAHTSQHLVLMLSCKGFFDQRKPDDRRFTFIL